MRFFDLFGESCAVEHLKQELDSRSVDVRITPTGLREFAMDAEAAAKSPASRLQAHLPYARRLHEEIEARAEFLRTWTTSDDLVPTDTLGLRLAGIARKYALPRPWRIVDPRPVAARHPTPTYLRWTSAP